MDGDFLPLKFTNSFNSMSTLEKEKVDGDIKELLQKGKKERWVIDPLQLNIEKKEFASGSFSTIHKCTWRGYVVVVKIPKVMNKSTLYLTLKEIEVWSSLRHPRLVQFLGVTIIGGKLCILMERISGVNLDSFIKKNPKKASKYALDIAQQVTQIIYFLHHCTPPIIYRDLKPENILIDDNMNVKLTDFGLSRFMPESSSYTMTGGTGTMRYIAPEVYACKKYDLKADIYSLGLILHYIFTHEIPFKKIDTRSMNRYLLENTKEYELNNKNIPIRLKDIIKLCCDYTASHRPNIEDLFITITSESPQSRGLFAKIKSTIKDVLNLTNKNDDILMDVYRHDNKIHHSNISNLHDN
jgi:serine/threonine protein kinase